MKFWHMIQHEPWNHYAKWNKPDTNRQILYDSTYMRYLEQSVFQDRKWNGGCQEIKGGDCLMGTAFWFPKMKRALCMMEDVLNATELYS